MSSNRSIEEVKDFLEDGYKAGSFSGVLRDNWANVGVTVDRTLRNPVVTKQHVEKVYKSFVPQKDSQSITGKQNMVIFQCDSRAPGTVNSKDVELEKSFMFFTSS